MDKIKEAASVIIDINKYRNEQIKDYDLIKTVCGYFDKIKEEEITQADLQFLKYISNSVGIPHFFDLLEKFKINTTIVNFDLNTLSAIIYESTLNLTENNKVHKYQKQILEKFIPQSLNRYFLSASTSFGKTHLVFDIIKKMEYENVVLIFPTIALLSENLERLASSENYQYFLDTYNIHTLSEVPELGKKNLFIYTPERFLSFIEKRVDQIQFDFAFVDEVYKIDNDYIIDEVVRENERDVAYRLAVFYSLKPEVDVLLAGPYIDFHQHNSTGYNASFDRFLSENQIQLIDYNNYEIVNKSFSDIKGKSQYTIDEELTLNFESNNKEERFIEIVKSIIGIRQNSIVYCYSISSVESYAKKLIASKILSKHDSLDYSDFITHVTDNFSSEWTVIEALKNGIGIHHGLVPKYLQKEIVTLFNMNQLKVLISTTTITEGVNTSAKNLVVMHSKKGNKELKKFDAKNIAGRAGRFLFHYSGRVIVLKNNFMQAINSDAEGIKHKNYDLEAPKDEIDLFYTNDEFLKEEDKQRIIDIKKMQEIRKIPDFVFSLYKVVSRLHKIEIYDRIQNISELELHAIKALIRQINFRLKIDRDGFQVLLNILEPIILNQNLKFLIEQKDKNERYSILTHLVQNYLEEGFMGSVKFKLEERNMSVDEAIRDTAKFVYNTLKYQVVKYLGVFNIMYKLSQSEKTNQSFEEVGGIDRLLTKLEYNALTESGRIASDYGVPSAIVDYYEGQNNAEDIKAKFDNYEKNIFEKVEKIIRRND
ncbi:helicase-related protein [Sphingobacterium faecium]|uniref:helicase-related protein n=1 Tax=Sphingobacterium faecium TaxID=34087 RepID=UPI00320A0FF0